MENNIYREALVLKLEIDRLQKQFDEVMKAIAKLEQAKPGEQNVG